MNKFWTYLNKGETNEFGRGIQDGLYIANPAMAELHNKLVPQGELSYRCLCTEQLLQTVLTSSLKTDLESSDSLNTYARNIDASPAPSNTISQSYPGIDVYLLDESADGWNKASFTIILNSTLNKASITSTLVRSTVEDFSITDNMSSKIPLSKGFYLRFRGALPPAPVTISVTSILAFRRNLNDILESLQQIRIPWVAQNYANIFNTSKVPVERVAAAAMNLYKGLDNA